MVRSKETVRKVGTPYREYMELRSMSRRPPPCAHVDAPRFTNSHDDSTSKKENGAVKDQLEDQDNSPSITIKEDCTRYPGCKYIVYCVSGAFVFLLCIILISLVFPYPMHASCTVKWKFDDPCIYTMQKFRSQILSWSSCINCGPRGSRCLYTLKEPTPSESNVIRAVHLGPNLRTMETMKIDFMEVNKTCVATGQSVSSEWFRIFDYGMNYCNLHNLVTAIGFAKSLELTTNALCTQYNMAVCD